jgi:hypothetical protein
MGAVFESVPRRVATGWRVSPKQHRFLWKYHDNNGLAVMRLFLSGVTPVMAASAFVSTAGNT